MPGYDADARRRIGRTVKIVELWPPDGPLVPPAPGFGDPGQQNIQRLRVTSGTPDAVAGINYYKARVRILDSVAGTWSDLTGFDAVRLFNRDGGAFATDDEAEARQAATVTIAGQVWPAFEGGAVGTCHIPDDAATVDPDGIYGVTCDPECCKIDFIEEKCSDDGTHTEWRRIKIYFPFKVKECVGEWETNYPPSDWDPCETPPSADFGSGDNSGLLVPLL